MSPKALEKSLYVDISYACYMLVIECGVVTQAPPIAAWMIGKPEEQVLKWLKGKDATVEIIL